MVKHTQKIRQIADKLSVSDHFVGLAPKGLRYFKVKKYMKDTNLFLFSLQDLLFYLLFFFEKEERKMGRDIQEWTH